MAERVIELILTEFKAHEHKTSPVLHEEALTDLSNVSGSEFKSEDDFRKLKNYCISLCRHLQVEETTMEKIFHRYGTNTEQVIALAESFTGRIADPYLRLELGGLLYGIRQEMVCTLSDYLVRRTNQLYFGRDQINKYVKPVLDTLADELQWSAEQKSKNQEDFMKEYELVMNWKNEKTL
jgi:glycerol-3-phosphate dehydrogenase